MNQTVLNTHSTQTTKVKTLSELNGKSGWMLFFIALGAFFLALGVIFGAFGAHMLEAKVNTRMLSIWQTAVLYQLIHGLGLLFLGGFGMALGYQRRVIYSHLILSGCMLVAGIVFFSGSLYVLVLTGVKLLGAITPIGGALFILGWLMIVLAILRFYRNSRV